MWEVIYGRMKKNLWGNLTNMGLNTKSKYILVIVDGIYNILIYYCAIEYIFPIFHSPYGGNVLKYFFAGVLIFYFMWKYWLNEKIMNFATKSEKNINQICAIFFISILLLSISIAFFEGEIAARQMVEDANSRFIDFEWTGISPVEIDGKELVLINYHEGNYYVVIHQNPAPEFPKVFIIPDDQINLAIIRK